MKFCILLRIYLVNSKKSSTFAAVSSKKAHCVFSEPPKPRWGGDNPPEIIQMETKFLTDANGITVDVASFRALVANQSTAQDYFGEKAPRNPSLVYAREWCEKELRKRSRHVQNLQILRAYCMAEQARLDAAEV